MRCCLQCGAKMLVKEGGFGYRYHRTGGLDCLRMQVETLRFEVKGLQDTTQRKQTRPLHSSE